MGLKRAVWPQKMRDRYIQSPPRVPLQHHCCDGRWCLLCNTTSAAHGHYTDRLQAVVRGGTKGGVWLQRKSTFADFSMVPVLSSDGFAAPGNVNTDTKESESHNKMTHLLGSRKPRRALPGATLRNNVDHFHGTRRGRKTTHPVKRR